MPVAPSEACVIGVDFGSLSGRAVIVRRSDGAELGSAVHQCPHAALTEALLDGAPLDTELLLIGETTYDFRRPDALKPGLPSAVRAVGDQLRNNVSRNIHISSYVREASRSCA